MEHRQIFGDENARQDVYLYSCKVPLSSQAEGQPILRGRWGVGKTATFLLRHRRLSEALQNVDPKYEYIWYLDEGGLDADTLFFLSQHYGSNKSIFKKALEKLWMAEILRSHGRVLSVLYREFGSLQGAHWSIIRSHEVSEQYGKSVWSRIADELSASSDLGKTVAIAVGAIGRVFSDQYATAVNKCLSDIKDHPLYPVVVIEPIETPFSVLEAEDVSLSQIVLVSLLDLFISRLSYAPSRGQFLRVEVSIPWHRSVREFLREPQKLTQYAGHFVWPEERLREFMNKRIGNEFEQLRRQFRPRRDYDEWSALFDNEVRNRWCRCNEDSFRYFLRHTHHRARDLMRLARTVVHAEVDLRRAKQPGFSVDDLLRGGGEVFVTQEAMRVGIEEALKESAEDRISEASRRYPQVKEVIEVLRSIEVPFSEGALAQRLSAVAIPTGLAIDMLWECGVIGFEIVPQGSEHVGLIEKNVGIAGTSAFHTLHREVQKRYFLFEYNSEMSPTQISRTFNGGHARAEMVVHPVFLEYLGVRPPREYPVGV